jgi:hypothetical protein
MDENDYNRLYEALKEIQDKLFNFQLQEEDLEVLRKLKLIDAELMDALHNMEILKNTIEKS